MVPRRAAYEWLRHRPGLRRRAYGRRRRPDPRSPSGLAREPSSSSTTARATRPRRRRGRPGARVLVHPENRGKGAALRTGMHEARALGFDVAVTVDADGQHRAEDALLLLRPTPTPGPSCSASAIWWAPAPRARTSSPTASRTSSSRFFAGRPLLDTQCGLRRYPLAATLGLDGRDDGYAFEAEVILRAIASGMPHRRAPGRGHLSARARARHPLRQRARPSAHHLPGGPHPGTRRAGSAGPRARQRRSPRRARPLAPRARPSARPSARRQAITGDAAEPP